MSVLKLLANDSFIAYNKIIAKQFGVNSAILLGALCSFQNSFGNVEFYKEQERISDDTCLSVYEIQQATKQLVGAGILEVKRKGIPAKNYYYVVDIKLSKILVSSDENFTHQEVKKVNDYINNNTTTNNTNNNTDNIKENIKEILDYLNLKAETSYKYTTEKTKSLINARLKEHFTVEDFKKVIDKMCDKWKGTDWEQYLRPETLFGTKFESYLNAKTVSNSIHTKHEMSQIDKDYEEFAKKTMVGLD